jgi:TRAP-type mannitol/chloroaromatic compound transport system permease small subunit
LQQIANLIDRLNVIIGRTIAWLTIMMVLVTCIIVLARYLFNSGSIALQESVMYMHGTVFMLGIAFTLKEQGHVRVDVLHERLGLRARAVIEMTGSVLFLIPVSVVILLSSLEYVAFSWSLKESSAQPSGLPGVYLLKTLITTMAGLLLLQGISEFIKAFNTFKKQAK